MNKLMWVVVAVVAAVALLLAGTWVYLNVVRDDPPPPLAFDTTTSSTLADTTTTTAPTTSTTDVPDQVEGRWVPTDASVVGYRVREVLFGQSAEGVGRTSAVEGELVIVATTVTSATFEVDMATVESDDNRRDNQFRGRIMDVATYPTATLALVEPIELDQIPDEGEVIEVSTQVELTLRGATRTVPLDLAARRVADTIELNGTLRVVFADWGIPNPSTVGITTDEEGDLEFLLVLERA